VERLRQEVATAYNQDPSLAADVLVIGLFSDVAESTIIRLQNVMEGLCHQIFRHATKRDAKGGRIFNKVPAVRYLHNQCHVQQLAQATSYLNCIV
jgi:hypothetical protein